MRFSSPSKLLGKLFKCYLWQLLSSPDRSGLVKQHQHLITVLFWLEQSRSPDYRLLAAATSQQIHLRFHQKRSPVQSQRTAARYCTQTDDVVDASTEGSELLLCLQSERTLRSRQINLIQTLWFRWQSFKLTPSDRMCRLLIYGSTEHGCSKSLR